MKVLIISDVHANRPALNAVLANVPSYDLIIHSGDILGYGPYPNDVVERFKELNVISITGNHDRAVLSSNFDFPEIPTEIVYWTRDQLTDSNRKYLEQLPLEKSIEIDQTSVQLVHGSPQDPDEYVYPDDISSDLVVDEDILVYGHTHYPIIVSIDGCLVLNPGSVGQPRDGDLRGSYILYDTESGAVELNRFDYPRKVVTEKILQSQIPSDATTYFDGS
ncbi:metallophosphoesterase family protein [Halobellus litoreus]|uniref:Phosphoesterase n=1 Tax=Halobellus litoreus TaxID=755310 RepID=A0ABD6DYG8_9EURY|nr:metallophosphoesterase family protein [Halobellus litoreus]